MRIQSLFNDQDETYGQSADKIFEAARRFAAQIAKKYPNVKTRDLEFVIRDGVEWEFVYHRIDKSLRKEMSVARHRNR